MGVCRDPGVRRNMKIIIADDHTLFRDALVQYIERAESSIQIHVTKDFFDAYTALEESQDFDLVLLDLCMPGMEGMNGLRKICTEFPHIKVALMSGVAEAEDVKEAIDIGACGYFPKTLSGKALLKAIQNVLNGEKFIPVDDDDEVMPSYYGAPKRANFGYGGMMESQSQMQGQLQRPQDDFNLTPREKEVLGFLANGSSNKEIANALGLQIVTVKLHVRGVCKKLDASNRTQAALKATQMGLVSSSAL